MTKFTYNDIVTVIKNSALELRPGEKAWVVSVLSGNKRPKHLIDEFPNGYTHTIEFEDGSAKEVHESQLEFYQDQD